MNGGGTARRQHPLCCLAVDCLAAGERSPEQPGHLPLAPAGDEVAVAGVLHKWTHLGRGWRSRWFALRGGVLSYTRIPGVGSAADGACRGGDLGSDAEVRLIGSASARVAGVVASEGRKSGIAYIKVSAFRESTSDDRKFYIFSPTKTLHLRTDAKDDRVAWIDALIIATSACSPRSVGRTSFIPNEAAVSTERLRDCMSGAGLSETIIEKCEQVMLSEFSNYHKHLKHHYEEQMNMIGASQHYSEDGCLDQGVRLHASSSLLKRTGFPNSEHEIISDYSTTESDELDKLECPKLFDEDEPTFFDTTEYFSQTDEDCTSILSSDNQCSTSISSAYMMNGANMMVTGKQCNKSALLPQVNRRRRLPEPLEKEKGVSLWSILKDSVGKDLTRVCLPVYFNEPLSSLQKCFEDLEYSSLLDQAYKYGKMGNNLMRILKVAAFAVSGYASSIGRPCKPFNPLLGETYEAEYLEKGLRFFAEKVSHHPMSIAFHCEGKGWSIWGDSNLKSKFWGQSIQLDPVGILTLEFDDGEIFQWSKVTTTIQNLIIGKLYCNHHGLMQIKGNRQFSCKLKFKEPSILDRSPRQVEGFVFDQDGKNTATVFGRWDESMYYNIAEDVYRKNNEHRQHGSLLWETNEPPPNPTRYNLSAFAITLNELTPDLQGKLPPTDSRRRPDQRHLENGEFEKANSEKLRLEKRQRMSTKLQEDGWKPRWFSRDDEGSTYRYVGGYWEAREQQRWDGCPDIFGELQPHGGG